MKKIGLIGCGNISSAYLNNNEVFPHMRIVKCADLRTGAAGAAAEKYGLKYPLWIFYGTTISVSIPRTMAQSKQPPTLCTLSTSSYLSTFPMI